MKAILAGGSGFIGKHLQNRMDSLDWDYVVLTREASGANDRIWDGKTLGDWTEEFEGADLVINLTGKSIGDRKTEANMQEMRDSRTQSTEAIGKAILQCENPPSVWINSSAVGFYGDRGQEVLTEASSPGKDFLASICVDWEDAISRFDTPSTRKSWIRTGVVLGNDGGALPLMSTAVKAFVGGTLGDGHQWIPWIHIDDLVALYFWVAERGGEGPYNGCNPNPEQNDEFMKTLRHVLHRPWAPPAPEWALEALKSVAPTDPTLALISNRVLPDRAEREGFKFDHSDLEAALDDLLTEGKNIE